MAFLSWILAKFTGAAIKGGAEIAKTLCEVPKTVIETEKARLEVLALKTQKEVRENLIVAATFQDVKEFDPMYAVLRQRIESDLRTPLGTGLRTRLLAMRPFQARVLLSLNSWRQPFSSRLRTILCQIHLAHWPAPAFRWVAFSGWRWCDRNPMLAFCACQRSTHGYEADPG